VVTPDRLSTADLWTLDLLIVLASALFGLAAAQTARRTPDRPPAQEDRHYAEPPSFQDPADRPATTRRC
jgi:hypothetical protein